jgi:RES domain-containing protein
VHVGAGFFPTNKYIIEIDVPGPLFARRQVVNPPPPDAWDAIPASYKSQAYGTNWALSGRRLVLDIPSAVVPNERNYLLNPRHPGIKKVSAQNLGRYLYDVRLLQSVAAPSKNP